MSVYPSFDQPSGKLYIGSEKHDIVEKICSSHYYNHAVDMILPVDEAGLPTKILQEGTPSFYYQASLSLSYFLNTTFLNQYVRQGIGGLTALRCNARIDTSDVFAVLPTGVLLLNVTKDTYESLGLVGTPCKFAAKGQRYVVEVNLSDPSFKKGNKLFDRVEWCFSHTLTNTYDFYLSFVNIQTGASLEISFPPNFANKRFFIQTEHRTLENILVPNFQEMAFDRFSKTAEGEEWRELAIDVFEWFGMLACEASRISATDKVDPFYSVYATPDPCQPTTVTKLSRTGFISSQEISSVMKQAVDSVSVGGMPWAAVMVWGFRDAPVSWRREEHGYLTGGENDYLVVFKPNNRCLVFQALGSNDGFSV